MGSRGSCGPTLEFANSVSTEQHDRRKLLQLVSDSRALAADGAAALDQRDKNFRELAEASVEVTRASSDCADWQRTWSKAVGELADNAEGAAVLRNENHDLRQRCTALAFSEAETERTLRMVEADVSRLRAERASLQAAKEHLRSGIVFLRQLPEGGTRSRIETLKHQLAACNHEVQRNAQLAAANQTQETHPGLLQRHTAKAAAVSQQSGATCVEIRQDIERLECKIADVRSTQALLVRRAEEMEAECKIAQTCPVGPRSAAWLGRPTSATELLPS